MAEINQHLVEFGPHLHEIGQFCPISARLRSRSAKIWPNSAHSWLALASGNVRLKPARIRLNSASESAQFRSKPTNMRPEPIQHCLASAHLRLTSSRIRLHSVQVWWKSAQFGSNSTNRARWTMVDRHVRHGRLSSSCRSAAVWPDVVPKAFFRAICCSPEFRGLWAGQERLGGPLGGSAPGGAYWRSIGLESGLGSPEGGGSSDMWRSGLGSPGRSGGRAIGRMSGESVSRGRAGDSGRAS